MVPQCGFHSPRLRGRSPEYLYPRFTSLGFALQLSPDIESHKSEFVEQVFGGMVDPRARGTGHLANHLSMSPAALHLSENYNTPKWQYVSALTVDHELLRSRNTGISLLRPKISSQPASHGGGDN